MNLTYKTIDGITYIKDENTNVVVTLDTLLEQFEAMQYTMSLLKDFGISQHTALSQIEANTEL